jgi:striatin 1/3/4
MMREQPQERLANYPPPQQQPLEEEEPVAVVNHVYDSYGKPIEPEALDIRKEGLIDADGWDFGDNPGAFLETTEVKAMPSRPDTENFPTAQPQLPTSPNRKDLSHRRRTSLSRRKSGDGEVSSAASAAKLDGSFKVRFGLRGHLDVVRTVLFTGGGSPGEPELCTAGDDGVIKRWLLPARYENGIHSANDLDIQPYFTHRGHSGSVMCLASFFPSANFASGGRAQGDGWVFSGGQDASIRVWERGRVDPKATMDAHTDAVWALCLLPTTCGAIFGASSAYGTADSGLLVSGSADGSICVWSVSAPPSLQSPASSTGRRAGGRQRGNSMSSGSTFPTSPQPSTASTTPFHYNLIHNFRRNGSEASPTCITSLSPSGENFAVSYNDASIIVYDTRTGEELASMASQETYDGTSKTAVNAIVGTTAGLDSSFPTDSGRGLSEEENVISGATGSSAGVEGTIISGHEDQFVRFFDANSGMSCVPFHSPISQMNYELTNPLQANAHTRCSPTRPPSPRSVCPPTVASSSAVVMTRA